MADIFETTKKVSEVGPILKELVLQFARIISNSDKFISGLRPRTSEDVIQALIFAAFTSFLNFLIWSMLLNVELKTLMLLTDTFITFLFWISYGLFFHIGAKLLKGKGTWQSSLSCYLYLTAFIPIISFVSVPHEVFRQELMQNDAVPGTVEWANLVKNRLLESPFSVDSISWLLGRLLWLYWLFRIYKVFVSIHSLSVVAGGLAVIVGFMLMFLCQSTFQNYVLWLLWDHWA